MLTDEISELKLPALDMISFGNIYSGNYNDFNFKIYPQVPNSKFEVFVWLGFNCLEKSELCAKEEFCLNEAGYSNAQKWLLEKFECLKNDV